MLVREGAAGSVRGKFFQGIHSMTDIQFKATIEMLIPLVIREIIKSRNISEQEAFELLYSSFLYSKLEIEDTKLWHLSQLTLANLLNEEIETGTIKFPEEA